MRDVKGGDSWTAGDGVYVKVWLVGFVRGRELMHLLCPLSPLMGIDLTRIMNWILLIMLTFRVVN